MTRRHIPFSVRLTLFSTLLITVSVALGAFVAYHDRKMSLESTLARELLGIVNSTAPLIDGDLHELIRVDPDGTFTPPGGFDRVRRTLVQVRNSNGLTDNYGSPIYTFRRAADFATTNELEFVVMSDRDGTGHFFTGHRYPALPHHLHALAGHPASTGIYTDENGVWISAVAPIRRTNGEVVGLLQADRHVTYYYAQARAEAWKILMSAMLTVALAAILSIPFSRTLVRPLQRLVAGTQAITAGDLGHRIETDGPVEFAGVADAFNRMSSSLAASSSVRDQLERDLRAAKERADEANRAKSVFLANMSHELRTPLNAIIGFTDHLLEPNLTAREQGEAIQIIAHSGRHLLDIISDVLDISKIEAGRLEVERITCSPLELVEEVRSLIARQASTRGLFFSVEFDGPLPESIRSDPTRVRQILINLLGNAVKFTKDGGIRLIVSLTGEEGPEGRLLRFAVHDTGVGIEDEQRDRLFAPFTQADASMTRQYGGTGLGLAISKRLANLLGGDVSVRSTFGQGSTFTLTVSTGPLEGVRLLEGLSDAVADIATGAKDLRVEESLSGLRILVAEDNAVNQRVILALLRKLGAEITIVENGQLAIERARVGSANGLPFHVILMDMQMPFVDGLTATRALRAEGVDIPIIAVTANALASDRDACLAAGCDDYVSKPIHRATLLQVIHKCLSRVREQRVA
jgi:signal transduction histidine kinase/ActR/RegA family two-component response regulator